MAPRMVGCRCEISAFAMAASSVLAAKSRRALTSKVVSYSWMMSMICWAL